MAERKKKRKPNTTARPKARERIATQKELAIELLKKTFGNVSMTCEKVGISRVQFYEWRREDPAFNAEVDAINDRNLDFVESQLMRGIEEGNAKLIMFYLNAKGRARGYGLRNESDGDKSGAITIRLSADEAEY